MNNTDSEQNKIKNLIFDEYKKVDIFPSIPIK